MEDIDKESCTTVVDVDDDQFFDAIDEFPSWDSCLTSDPEESISVYSCESFDSDANLNPCPEDTFPTNPRFGVPDFSCDKSWGSNSGSSVSCKAISGRNRSFRKRRFKFSRILKENASGKDELDSVEDKFSFGEADAKVVENEKDLKIELLTNARDDALVAVHTHSRDEIDGSFSSFLIFLAGQVIRIISFQVNLLLIFPMLTLKLIYLPFMFVIDPFGTIKRCFLKIWGSIYATAVNCLDKWLKKQKIVWKTALKCGWGLLWSFYVCALLVIFLILAFILGGIVMWFLLEKPIQLNDTLNFDYTQQKPVAYVPIIVCPDISCGTDCDRKVDVGEFAQARVIPLHHKLQISVALTLPESDNNRNLGIFMVRVDFLSADGKSLSTLTRPCMLQFKSHPIRLLLTLFQIAPLAFGYTSETQNVVIHFRDYKESYTPTSCIRVSIDQRAEFQRSSGIPQIYSASVCVKSELPILKRMLWYWKTTVYVWVSITWFIFELLFALLCCNPIIIPRVRLRAGLPTIMFLCEII